MVTQMKLSDVPHGGAVVIGEKQKPTKEGISVLALAETSGSPLDPNGHQVINRDLNFNGTILVEDVGNFPQLSELIISYETNSDGKVLLTETAYLYGDRTPHLTVIGAKIDSSFYEIWRSVDSKGNLRHITPDDSIFRLIQTENSHTHNQKFLPLLDEVTGTLWLFDKHKNSVTPAGRVVGSGNTIENLLFLTNDDTGQRRFMVTHREFSIKDSNSTNLDTTRFTTVWDNSNGNSNIIRDHVTGHPIENLNCMFFLPRTDNLFYGFISSSVYIVDAVTGNAIKLPFRDKQINFTDDSLFLNKDFVPNEARIIQIPGANGLNGLLCSFYDSGEKSIKVLDEKLIKELPIGEIVDITKQGDKLILTLEQINFYNLGKKILDYSVTFNKDTNQFECSLVNQTIRYDIDPKTSGNNDSFNTTQLGHTRETTLTESHIVDVRPTDAGTEEQNHTVDEIDRKAQIAIALDRVRQESLDRKRELGLPEDATNAQIDREERITGQVDKLLNTDRLTVLLTKGIRDGTDCIDLGIEVEKGESITRLEKIAAFSLTSSTLTLVSSAAYFLFDLYGNTTFFTQLLGIEANKLLSTIWLLSFLSHHISEAMAKKTKYLDSQALTQLDSELRLYGFKLHFKKDPYEKLILLAKKLKQ
jgi:hypothetical protein